MPEKQLRRENDKKIQIFSKLQHFQLQLQAELYSYMVAYFIIFDRHYSRNIIICCCWIICCFVHLFVLEYIVVCVIEYIVVFVQVLFKFSWLSLFELF